MNIFIVLPAYNESDNIRPLFEKIALLNAPGAFASGQAECGVMLVNDGSTDNTAAAAKNSVKNFKLYLEEHGRNMGLGHALRTGLKKALSLAQETDAVVVMDADNSHDPALIAVMRGRMLEGYDVVVASRYAPGGEERGLSRLRKFLSRSCSKILKYFFPINNIKDYTCGYRMYGVPVLRKLSEITGGEFFKENGFVCMSEMLVSLNSIGAKMSEIPLVLRYDLKKGQSKMKIWRTIAEYFALVWRFKCSS